MKYLKKFNENNSEINISEDILFMMDDILLDIKDMGYYYSIFSKEKKYNRICVSVSGKRKPILRKDIDGVIVTLNKLESYLESVGIKIYKIELNMRSGSSSYGVNNSSISRIKDRVVKNGCELEDVFLDFSI